MRKLCASKIMCLKNYVPRKLCASKIMCLENYVPQKLCLENLALYGNLKKHKIVKFETLSLSKCCLCAGVTLYLETGSGSEEAVSSLVTDNCPEEVVRTTFAGVQCALTSALRVPRLKSEVNMKAQSISPCYIYIHTTNST